MKLIRYILPFLFCIALTESIIAQTFELSGKVIDKTDKQPLPGVNVLVQGTSLGTATDFDGNFKLMLSNQNSNVAISFIGYKSQIISASEKSYIVIELELDAEELGEVVVTALGIKRAKKSLGYSVQEVSGDDLRTAKDVNVINQMAGKVSGLRVTGTTGGPGSSSRVVMRGNTSIAGDNQALIVVDGVPINNNTSNTTSEWGGYDFGSGINDINSEDIESVSVLKGASAAALYGSMAANGVILITTKKGPEQKGVEVNLSTNTTFEEAYILADFQNEYGAGRNGKFEGAWEINDEGIPVYNTASAAAFGSWGPKMEGQTIIDWDGKQKTFEPQPNNYSNYFQTGITSNNAISLQQGFEKINYRFSYSNLHNNDIVPKTNLRKHMFSLSSIWKITSNLSVDFSTSYTYQKAQNRLGLSNSFSAPRNIVMMPRHISDESLKENMMNEAGVEQVWYTNWGWMTNPYFYHTYNLNHDYKGRFIRSLKLDYKILPNLNAMLRSNIDSYLLQTDQREAYNSFYNPRGRYYESLEAYKKLHSDFLLSFNTDFSEHLSFSANAGGAVEYWYKRYEYVHTKDSLNGPFEYVIPENSNVEGDTLEYKKLSNSLYATTQLAYKNYLFLDATYRQDWSSSLPKVNRSFVYPSLSLGYIFTDHLNIKSTLFPYGKLRLSTAQVGNDSEPYMLQKTYITDVKDFNGLPLTYVKAYVPLANMKPVMTTSYEGGTDLRFFNNRIAIDFTLYQTSSTNQILRTNISAAAGSSQAVINTGEIVNKGIELQLNTKLVKSQDLQWSVILNYAKNHCDVISLDQGLDKYNILNQWRVGIEARPGNPYGDIVGYEIMKDANGNKLVDAETGLFIRNPNPVILGNIQPDFTGGISNQFAYKGLSASFVVDFQIGGDMFAGTNMYAYGYSGNFAETLEGREGWYASEEAREAAGVAAADWEPTGGFLVEGVDAETGEKISKYLNPEKYWDQFSAWTEEIHEPFIYDASFVKLRELSVGYQLPASLTQKVFIESVNIAFVGRNLWLMYSKVPNIDPESYYTNGNGQGIELYSYPTRRSMGFSVKIDF